MDVSVNNAPTELPEARINALIDATLAKRNQTLDSISVAFVGPDQMKAVNRERRGKDRPTDVLSFPFGADFPQGSGGEVLICPEVAKDAPITGQGLQAELEWLLVHGLLHLTGMEDETEAGSAEMDRLTAGIMAGMERHG